MVNAWFSVSTTARRSSQVAKAAVGAGLVAMLARVALELAARVHLLAASVLAFLLAAGALWLTRQVKRATDDADPAGVVGVLVLGLLTTAVVGSWLSYSLHIGGVPAYAVNEPYSMGTFMDAYMYAFLDLVPALKIPETLHLSSPVQSTTIVGGLPILGFKVFVVWLLFDAGRSWLRSRRETPRAAS